MVHNIVIPTVVLPCCRCTDVRLERNWTFDLQDAPFVGPLLPNVPANEGDGIDDKYERRNQSPVHNVPPPHASPAHTPPFTHAFAGTSTGHYFIEEMMREKRAREEECNSMLYAMYEHQWDSMDFMRLSQRQNE